MRTPALSCFALVATVSVLAAQTPPPSEVVKLSEFVVDSSTDRGYVATNVVSASRIPVALRDMPLTATVLTEQFLRDFGVLDHNDALRYATGMRKAFETETAYYLRGQRINYQLRNGFVRWDFTPAVNLQRVEVIKGPAAILYGLSFPGGVVNYLTKRPVASDFAEVGLEFGSFDYLRGTLDINRQLLSEGKLVTRLVASKQDGGSYIKDDPNIMETFSPSVIYKPTNTTTLFFEYDYSLRRDNQYAFGRPVITNAAFVSTGLRFTPDVLPIDTSPGRDGFKDQYSRALTFEVEQKFGRRFTGRFTYNYAWREETEIKWGIFGARATDLVTTQGVYANNFRNWDENFQAEIVGRVETGPIQHRLLAGFQYFEREFLRRQRSELPQFARTFTLFNVPPLPSTDFFNSSVWTPINYTGSSGAELPGYYLVDTLSMFNERLFILAGARYTKITQKNPRAGTTDLSQDRFSPQIGANFRVLPTLSAYVLFSESLQPNGSNTNPPGFGPQGAFDPQLGQGYDIGLKFSFLQEKISGSVAYFDVARSNVPQNDVALTNAFRAATGQNGTVRILSGEETTRGVEVELVFSPLPGWQIVTGYQHIGFAEITADANPARVGLALGGVADNQLNLYTKYEFQQGELKGFAVGGGFTYVSDVSLAPEFYPSTTQTDVFAQYRTRLFNRPTQFFVNINNLFDEENATSRGVYAPPFRIRGGMNIRF
jgi:iron complex outermembrane receptor protein